MNTADYMNLVMSKKGLRSDAQIAQNLNWSRQKVSNYRHNKQTMDNEAAREYAEFMNMDLLAIIADMEAQRQKDPSKKKAWSMLAKLSKQTGTVTCNLLITNSFISFLIVYFIYYVK